MQYQQYLSDHGDYDAAQPSTDKRSQPMTTAAIILSVIAISTVCCFYVSFACAALGITFALLSKGGELTMSQNAKAALWINTAAIFFTVTLTIASFVTIIFQYGSLDAFMEEYYKLYL